MSKEEIIAQIKEGMDLMYKATQAMKALPEAEQEYVADSLEEHEKEWDAKLAKLGEDE